MGKHKSSLEEKVRWLVKHPEIWRGWPGNGEMDKIIISAMRKDGLIAEGSHNFDIGDLGRPIAIARFRLRGRR